MTQCGVHSYSYEGTTERLTIRNCTVVGCEVTTDEGTWMNYGLDIVSTSDVLIEGNSITETLRAIEMMGCADVTCSNNSLMYGRELGLGVSDSSNVTIQDNDMVANVVSGLSFGSCDNVTVTRNYLAGNNYGIYGSSSYTAVYRNDLVGNNANAYSSGGLDVECHWDGGYPVGGNYWSDYEGSDEFSGPDQDIPGSDGVGDTSYPIGWMTGFEDRYPLMSPCLSPFNEPPVAVIDISPPVGITSTVFTLDASGSHDSEDSVEDLSVRWDVGYDGSWEVDWTAEKSFTWVFPEPGSHLVHMQVRDTAMLIGDTEASVTVYEETPPATFLELTGTEGENGWYVSSVEAALGAYGVNDIERTEYRVDSSDWQQYVEPFEVSGDGVHALEFYSVDVLGAVEATRSAEVMVDCQAPELDLTALNDNVFETGNISVMWNCSDAVSGVASAAYALDGADPAACAPSLVIALSDLDEGSHTLTVTVTDEAGNIASQSVSFVVELADPPETDEDDEGAGGLSLEEGAALVAAAAAVAAACYLLLMRRGRSPKM
jgi:hypothetical protein